MNNPVTQASHEVVCKDEKCSEHIVLTTPRKQKSKTVPCPKGHKHTYDLKRDPIKRSRLGKSRPTSSSDFLVTTIIVIVAVLLGAIIGRLLAPALDWLLMVEVWAAWVKNLWVIAWGCLGGFIALTVRNN